MRRTEWDWRIGPWGGLAQGGPEAGGLSNSFAVCRDSLVKQTRSTNCRYRPHVVDPKRQY